MVVSDCKKWICCWICQRLIRIIVMGTDRRDQRTNRSIFVQCSRWKTKIFRGNCFENASFYLIESNYAVLRFHFEFQWEKQFAEVFHASKDPKQQLWYWSSVDLHSPTDMCDSDDNFSLKFYPSERKNVYESLQMVRKFTYKLVPLSLNLPFALSTSSRMYSPVPFSNMNEPMKLSSRAFSRI